MTLNDIIDINLLDRFLTNLKNLFLNKDGTAIKAASIPFGTVDSTSNATAFTATVNGITELRDGVSLYLKNNVVTSAAASTAPKCWTLNINNLGAKPVYVTTAAATYSTTHFTKNYKMLFTYDTSLNDGNGGWYIGQLYNSNTTYSEMTQTEIDAGTGTTGRRITPKMLRDNFYTEGEVNNLLGNKANSNDLATVATSGSYNDLDDTPTIPTVPTNVSAFNNDAGYLTSYTESDPTVPSHVKGITTTDISNWNGKQAAIADLSDIRSGAALGATALQSYTETDPTVPAWAKAANKPSYTAAEVGALPDSTTIPSASTATPQMDGTGAAGSASTYAKGDHVHPTDTSRKPAVTEVSHGTSNTTFALTPNVLHTWGTVSSLNLTLGSGSSTYVDEYMFKFTTGTGFTLTLPSTVEWYNEPQFNEGKTYEVSIVDGYACSTADIDMSTYAKVSQINTQLALKRDVIPIVSTTVTSGGSLNLSANTYYNITSSLTTATFVLPTISGNYAESVILYFTTGNNPTITFSSSLPVYYTDTYSIEAGTTYEVNAMCNGSAWIIASGTILTS